MRDLTSLFGMGRGEHPRKNHHKKVAERLTLKAQRPLAFCVVRFAFGIIMSYWEGCNTELKKIKAYGQLVLLGFTVTSFTPIAYQRHSL